MFEFRTVSRWVGLGLAVGVVAGLGATGFFFAMEWIRYVVLGGWGHVPLLEPHGEHAIFAIPESGGQVRYWIIVLAPAIGGLISGLLVFGFAPEAEGHGTDALIESFHHQRGRIRPRVPVIKALASAVLIGTGGSAGREGPIAQIGAGFGSILGGLLKFSDRERRLLLVAGAAGGIGAIFRSPLGGALFVLEVLYRDDFEVDGLVPAVLSSVVAYSVFTAFVGHGTIFATAAHYRFDPRQLPFYLVMAVGAALVGVLYIKVFYGARDKVFARLRIPRALKPAIGGLIIGLLALVVPQALGAGYGWLQEAIVPRTQPLMVGWAGAAALLGIALTKVLTTSLSVSSGGSGGVFGPSVVIGGMVGGAFGIAFHELAPALVPDPGAFVVVGMACFFGGVAHAPISSLVLASEMTGGYELLVPIMLAEVVTFIMVGRWTLYEKQVPSRRDSPAHGGEYVLDVLQNVRVSEVYDKTAAVVPVRASTPLPELLHQAAECTQTVFPVVDEEKHVRGIITLETLRGLYFDEDIAKLAIAADCAVPFVSVTPEDTLGRALERFAKSHYPELPVVDPEDRNRVLGLLGYEDVLQAYSRELMRRRLDRDGEVAPIAASEQTR